MTRNSLLSGLALILALSTTAHAAPVTDLTKIVLGEYHGCGITRAGALRCFGNNGDGQLGAEQRLPNSFSKYAVTVLPAGVTDVAISQRHTCAVMDRALYCWGNNRYGQLGLGKTDDKVMTPTRVSAVSGEVTSVATGGVTTCVILAPHGALQCWGRNDLGQVGNGTKDSIVSQPVTVIPEGVTAVAIGGQHTCAVVNGGLQCWGYLLFNDPKTVQQPVSDKANLPPLPPPDDFKTLLSPTTIIPAGNGVTAVAANMHTCLIVKGALQCWGRNFHNQVGVEEGARVAPKKPTTIIASGVTAMALSAENTCAVVKGELLCWGWNNNAQLGSPASAGSKTPAPLSVPGAPPATVQSAAIGMRQVCVLTGASTDREASLLQCTNRTPDPEDVDQTDSSAATKQWQNFGTEGAGLSGPPSVLPRIARYGLWQGTIGTLDVMTLLTPADCGAGYYYKKHLLGIELIEKERRQGGIWLESPGTDHEAKWVFSALSPDGRTLSGEWHSRDGKRQLPIHLTLAAPTPSTPGENGKPRYDCSPHDKAFNAPRIAQARQKRVVSPSDLVFQGVDGSYRYRTVALLDGRINGFTLPNSRHNPRLQQAMEEWENANVSEFYGCAQGMARLNETTPDFSFELSPLFWNKTTLVLRENYSAYCGGAHPSGGVSSYRVWDLIADRPVNIWTWIAGSDAEYSGRIASQKLRDLIAARYSRRNETGENSCADALDSQEFYLMYPTKTGMVFTPSLPHVIQACVDDIQIPWAEMRPFLSPAGRKALSNVSGP